MGNGQRYVVFETAWGFFGLGAVGECLRRSSLPLGSRQAAVGLITGGRQDCRYDATLLSGLQDRVRAYFEGTYTDFSNVPLEYGPVSSFAERVLDACRRIPYGQTASYARLGQLAGFPKAARGAGSVMAANPLPLIVPCHRIIRSDGRAGCFSAPGGPELKQRLLALEAQGMRAANRQYSAAGTPM